MNTISTFKHIPKYLTAIKFYLILLLSAATFSSHAHAELIRAEVESGAKFITRLDFRDPPTGGDTVALDGLLDSNSAFHYRLEAWLDLPGSHKLRAMFTPLFVETTQTPTENLRFKNTTFAAGIATNYQYKFNSYRLTYIYQLISAGIINLDIGFTAKIREAKIQVEQPNLNRSEGNTNVGFVPLLYAEASVNLGLLALVVQADALASPGGQGRAIDLSAKLRFAVFGPLYGFAGYRWFDGGANSDSVYTFATVQHALIGVGAAL